MSQDPNLTDANSPEFYKSGLKTGQFGQRNADQISNDLNAAHDNIRKLVGKNDQLQKQVIELTDYREKNKLWTAVLVASVTPVWTVLGKAIYLFLVRK